MQIACPNCATTYQIADSSLGTAGRSVRCVRCRNVWFAANTAALSTIARDHRSDVTAFAAANTIGQIIGEPPGTALTAEQASALNAEVSITPVETLMPAEAVALAAPQAPDEPVVKSIDAADAPPLAPTDEDAPPFAEAAPNADIETLATRRDRRTVKRKRRRWASPGLSTIILLLIAVNTALLGWRTDIVRLAPQTASLYAAVGFPVNLRGLAFTDVATEKETSDAVQVLVIKGTITNVAPRAVEVPRLRFAVRNKGGNEIYTWTALPSRSVLGPGETLEFRSRLASPPRDAYEILVRFFNRRDLIAGIQ